MWKNWDSLPITQSRPLDVDEEKTQSLKLYPNPTKGQFMIELHLSNNINAKAKIEMVNMMGQTVSAENANISNGVLQKTVFISSSLSAGIYMVKISADNKTYFSKLKYEKFDLNIPGSPERRPQLYQSFYKCNSLFTFGLRRISQVSPSITRKQMMIPIKTFS
ncbi:MAG: T9SS type A sorting domain-containing protein [Ferruginibacter sp.]